ncbi:hypothetical protein AVEN_20200-1 [Araneus ventricosus]|uniref:Uncharacterized protein n=1 Tax=Araneus ventricosus TaxID=182803 RepID=A0A4Y2CLY8_ARAVE|nr:hypothetical protein AVEN_20200-1 [Araneus ventricosus]
MFVLHHAPHVHFPNVSLNYSRFQSARKAYRLVVQRGYHSSIEAFDQKAPLLESIQSLIFPVLFCALFGLHKFGILCTIFRRRCKVGPNKIAPMFHAKFS